MHRTFFQPSFIVLLFLLSSCFGHHPDKNADCQGCQAVTQHPERSFVRILGAVGPDLVVTASGSVIANDEVGSYILTAAHVCTFLEGSGIPPELQDKKDLIIPHLSLHGQFFNAKMSPLVIVTYEERDDLCLMYAPLHREVGLSVTKDLPEVDTKYRSISSPGGKAAPGRVLTFEGYYAGSYPIPEENFEGDLYTIWNAKGGSGSPILNSDNQIVGIISRVMSDGTPAVISPNTKALQTFVQRALCVAEVEGFECSEAGD